MRRISISLSLAFSSHSAFSQTAVILAPPPPPIFPPALFCDVVESIYRGFPRPSARLLVLFSSSTIRAQVRSYCRGGSGVGPYRSLLLVCGKPQPGYGREDLIKTKRNEPRKTTGVHLSRSRGNGLTLPSISLSLASALVSRSNRPLATAFILPSLRQVCSFYMLHEQYCELFDS